MTKRNKVTISRGGGVLRGESVPKRNSRNISRITIKCPECGAEVGEACKSSTEKACKPHLARIRMTTREYNKEHSKAPSRIALTILGIKLRHALEPGEGITDTGNVHTLCGKKINYTRASANGRLAPGMAADVTCTGCLAVLENGKEEEL